MKKFSLFLVLVCILGCSSVRVSYDYERDQDWTGYKTFNFYPDMQTGLSDLDLRRLLAAVETTLRQRGFTQSEEPDFVLNIYSEAFHRPSGTSVGVGMGGTGGSVGGGVSVGIPLSGGGPDRRITFDIIDTSREILVWQAATTDRIRENATPNEREQRFQAMAEKVFTGFPPRR